jgi:site-specific DNA-methyltransferase (adenine-specific)
MSPEPYYQDDLVTLYHGDCRAVLPDIRRQSVDLVLTDPPFFMPATHYQSRVQWQRSWGDTSVLAAFWGVVLDAAIPALRPTGHLISFCNGDSYPVFYPEVYRRFDSIKCIVWDKGSIGMGRVWRNQHELILAARWETSLFSEKGGSRSDVLRAKVIQSGERSHPVEKPTAVLAPLIEPTTQPGGIVLDPFAGSGSTLIAARTAGRCVIGIEAEERYCEAAALRLAQDVLDFGDGAA